MSFVLALVFATFALDSQAKQARDALTADSADTASSLEPNRFDGGISEVFHDRLANGMDVILAVRKRAPMMTVSIIYRTPPVTQSVQAATYSRLLASLLPTLDTRHLSAYGRNQLQLAADTTFDQPQVRVGWDDLVLSLSIMPSALDLALFTEADRMGFSADNLTQADIDAATSKPHDSKSRKSDVLESALNRLVFEPGHPYSSGDSPSSPDHFELSRVKQYMRRYLQAGNATLVITGDLNAKGALRAIENTFGRLSGGSRVPRELPEMLPHAQKRIEMHGNDSEQFILAWQSPAYLTADDTRLDVLGEVLAQRLRVGAGDLCPRSWATQASRALGSRFMIGCDHGANFDGPRWESYAADTLRNIANGASSIAEVQLARDKVWTKTFERLDSPESLAPILDRQLALGRSVPSVVNSILPYASVTKVELADVVRRYLLRPADAAVELHHDDVAESKPTIFAGETSVDSDKMAEIRSADDPAWLRPPRRAKQPFGGTWKYGAFSLSGDDVLFHFDQPGFPYMQANWRLLLRSGDFDPRLALVAMYEFVQGDERTPPLADRLWNDFAVIFTWRVNSNSLSIQLNGPPPRVEQVVRVLRKALNAPHGVVERLDEAKKAASAHSYRSTYSLLEELDLRLGSPLVRKWDHRRLTSRRERIAAMGTKQIAAFWATVASHTKLDVAVIGPSISDEVHRMAATIIPASWQRVALRVETTVAPPRIWVLDEERRNLVDIQVIWPILERHGEIGCASALAGLSRAAKALGNVNAARPRNPTTQFTIDNRAFVDTVGAVVAVSGIEMSRLETVLRELDGYFARLVERVDFPQLARLGQHDLSRAFHARFASTSKSMSYLDEQGLIATGLIDPGTSRVSARDRIAAFAKTLTLDRAIIVARGPALRLEPVLRNVNHGEWIVVPPEAL